MLSPKKTLELERKKTQDSISNMYSKILLNKISEEEDPFDYTYFAKNPSLAR
jgi:hypothetical protein